ncbi:hypothetical protein ACHAWO_009063 [Cyclotella atomus]|uniref:Uncharacterized protein n=1 Tax=Cyclotella atomus TaxID=382360 RepID=A0ABD3PJ89_9STRA
MENHQQSLIFCSIFETDSDRAARSCISHLQSNPIPIWWYRRRVHSRQGEESVKEDLSPFPKSWSLNYSPQAANEFRKKVGIPDEQNVPPIDETGTDESSMYSTVSQEKRNKQEQRRDGDGFCIRHPSVKLAEKKRKPRLSKLFGKNKRLSLSQGSDATDEWKILLEECPECKLDSLSNSKHRSRSKSSQNEPAVTYEPFPATITIVESHPDLSVGSLALRIRTDPIPTEQARQLSSVLDDNNKDKNTPWETPDGALDFSIPCDSEGNVINDDKEDSQPSIEHQYQIMERIIPISSIDHIFRGGDAWDVLRQSMGDEDLGFKCDLKIHGFSDRLLRFDVVGFGNQSINGSDAPKMRHSFAVVDFLRSSVAYVTEKNDQDNDALSADAQWEIGNYTSENVMSNLNSLVTWDRERRETGVESWANCFATFLKECLSLGVPNAGKFETK